MKASAKTRGVFRGLSRGSAAYVILSELERYPERWFRWYQFPVDCSSVTAKGALRRLVESGRVESRIVEVEEPSCSTTRGEGVWVVRMLEYRWKGDPQ